MTLIEVPTDNGRALINMDQVQAVSENGDKTDFYLISGVTTANVSFDVVSKTVYVDETLEAKKT
jgi:hypothetical protein